MLLRKFVFAPVAFALVAANAVAQAPVSDIERSRSYGATSVADSNMSAALYQQLQQLRQEVMALRGTVEEQENQIRLLKQQSLDRYIDIDRRLSSISRAGLADPEAGAAAGEAINAQSDAEDTQTAVAGSTAIAAPVAAPASTVNPGSGNASSDYARAYSLVGSREYQKAIEAFTKYVQQYPQETYTPNAWYWLGELYVAVDPQNLEAATQSFQHLLSEYPENRKVPAAMYKLATVYYLQGDKQRAEEMLTHVIDRYGNTGNSAVKKSREFLRKNF